MASSSVGPRSPTLPKVVRSMSPHDFTLQSLSALGVHVTPESDGLYLAKEGGGHEYIRFQEQTDPNIRSTFYSPESPAFRRLVSRIVATGQHRVDDLDHNSMKSCDEVARKWSQDFGAKLASFTIDTVSRVFTGNAIVRVRANVAHDSYERLVDIPCSRDDHSNTMDRSGLDILQKTIERPETLGLNIETLKSAASLDEGIAEFSRFYLERREHEIEKASDERKRKKLQDEFTPRLEMTLVGLEGQLHRKVALKAKYSFDAEDEYESTLSITPFDSALIAAPELSLCSKSGRTVPRACLSKCEITGAEVLRHLLVKSDVSDRLALPEFTVLCSQSGRRLLREEADVSVVTGRLVSSDLLKVSARERKSGRSRVFWDLFIYRIRAPREELAVSELSGKELSSLTNSYVQSFREKRVTNKSL